MARAGHERDNGSKLEAVQSVATIAASVATVVGIIVGGFWTYTLFVEQRMQFPHLKVEHSVRHVDLPNNRVLLIVDITHSNVGTVKVSLLSAHVKVYTLKQDLTPEQTQAAMAQLQDPEFVESPALWESAPENDRRQTWDRLLVEPGESNQIHYEFVLGKAWPVLIYSFFKNPDSKDLGWETRSLYDPRQPPDPRTRP